MNENAWKSSRRNQSSNASKSRQQLLLGSGPAAFRLRLDKPHRPPLLAALEERDDEVVLGGEVSVERGLGDTRAPDDLVDADISDAAARE
jgi:hypothetical protein